MSWTQAICKDCWNERNPDRQALQLLPGVAEEETCCYCGETTAHGIFTRVDPSTVPFPSVTT